MLSPQPPPPPVASLERRLEDLPMLPAVVVDVLALDPESDDYFDRTLELVERDRPFAARVLRIANSPLSAPTRPIMSVRQAVTRVGAKQCAELVLALAVMRVFVPRSEARRVLWIHALQTALCARKACLHNPAFKNRADQAYLCGLLHDIGRFVQFDGAPDDLTRIDDSQWSSPRELVEVEQASLGYDMRCSAGMRARSGGCPHSSQKSYARTSCTGAPCSRSRARRSRGDVLACVRWGDHISIAMLADPGFKDTPQNRFGARMEAQFPDLVATKMPVDVNASGHWLPGIHRESQELAQHLGLSAAA